MTIIIDAVFEDGLLRPLTPLKDVPEHTPLRISIESLPEVSTPHPLLKFCGTVSDEDTREIEKIITDEFERVDPNEWN